MAIVGRRAEQASLRSFLESDEAEFVAVYGRRRVGKTFLIRETFGNDFTFYATGLADGKKPEQLASFADALKAYGGSGPAPTSWFEAFVALRDLVKESTRPGKKVIFLDELPWFDTPKSGFLTGLEWFWNSYASARHDVVLIVCGSAASWIARKLFRNRGGLHNRVTQRIHLEPFTLAECAEFFAGRGVELNRYQIAEYYMVFGGIPYYLRLIKKGLGLAQNIDRLCFGDAAPLADEFQEVLGSQFRDGERHARVIRALATKTAGLTRDELIAATGLAGGGNFSQVVEELEVSGFIRSYRPFGRAKKETLYQLVDFFSLFASKFMGRKAADDGGWATFAHTPAHSAWTGYAFEQVCLAHLPAVKRALGISGVATSVGSWRSARGARPGAQVDLVIDRADGIINLCEIKYANDDFVIDTAYATQLRNKRAALAAAAARHRPTARKAIHLTFITTYGVAHNAHWNDIQSEVTLSDLFTP
jgi:predicted AAA+ superfamily ATPase